MREDLFFTQADEKELPALDAACARLEQVMALLLQSPRVVNLRFAR